MEQAPPRTADPRRADAGPEPDVFARLEARLDDASRAAERLIAQAAAAAGGRERPTPPPQGWQLRRDPAAEAESAEAPELQALVELWNTARELLPPDLRKRVGDALRELLLAVRALIDWYLERLEHRREETPEVQDIPIA